MASLAIILGVVASYAGGSIAEAHRDVERAVSQAQTSTFSDLRLLPLAFSPSFTFSLFHLLPLTPSPSFTFSLSHLLRLSPSPSHAISLSHLLPLTPSHVSTPSRHHATPPLAMSRQAQLRATWLRHTSGVLLPASEEASVNVPRLGWEWPAEIERNRERTAIRLQRTAAAAAASDPAS
eukprot:620722-Prymnesium_polylepis.1